jgi:PAS domain S-box-containing protein
MTPTRTDAVAPETNAERLQRLIDAITDNAIYLLDNEGFVRSWNSGAERLIGYPPAEIIGQYYARFFSPEDRRDNLPGHILAKATAVGRYECEGWRVRKDGTRFWASAITYLVQDADGKHIGFAKVTRDITERKATQNALLESERRFRILVQGVTDCAIYMLDPSGIVSNWNAGAERIKGYTADEIVGQHFSRFYTREERAAGAPARALETASREGRYEAEGWRLRKDGSQFWAAVVVDAIRSDAGDLLGFAKITRDITERQQAHERLRESERHFRLLVNGITDYALYMLDPNGIVTNWNSGAARIKGYAADEIVGHHFSRFYTESEKAAGLPARALRTAAAEGRFETEAWRVRKDGSIFWANVVIDPIYDDRGKLVGYSKITRDITERHEAQKALQETQAQLAQVQKMEALGHLTGGVAHDFNNLLMVVSGYIPMIRQRMADDPKGLAAAEAIELAAKRGATLTRQLLSFSRRQSLNPSTIQLDGVVEATRPILSSLLGGTVKCVTTILPDIWPVRVDVGELELAIVNLSVNARDAMNQGGLITVAAENVRLSGSELAGKLQGDFVALTVADTGHGIPPDILTKVFDPFFTTKEVGKGTGLGLSQVHGFVHQSGGTVDIQSEMGVGTRITLYLPRASAEMPAVAEAGVSKDRIVARKVLLVEDNPEVAAATTKLLGRLDCTIEAVGDAQAALHALDVNDFDLVLADIVMAGPMNGLTLARAIRQRRPGVPVILATGYSEAAAEVAAEFPVLRKPYDVSDLSKAIAMVTKASHEPPSAPKVIDLRSAKRQRAKTDRSRDI